MQMLPNTCLQISDCGPRIQRQNRALHRRSRGLRSGWADRALPDRFVSIRRCITADSDSGRCGGDFRSGRGRRGGARVRKGPIYPRPACAFERTALPRRAHVVSPTSHSRPAALRQTLGFPSCRAEFSEAWTGLVAVNSAMTVALFHGGREFGRVEVRASRRGRIRRPSTLFRSSVASLLQGKGAASGWIGWRRVVRGRSRGYHVACGSDERLVLVLGSDSRSTTGDRGDRLVR